MSFGNDIYAERKRRRVTQQQLADKLGIDRNALVQVEKGRIDVTAGYYAKALRALDELAAQPAPNGAAA